MGRGQSLESAQCENCWQLTRDQISKCLPVLTGELAAHPSVHYRRCPKVPESRSEARAREASLRGHLGNDSIGVRK